MPRLKRFAIIFLLGLISCAEPSPLSTLEEGEYGRVVRVRDGDTLVLDTGLAVRLAGIEAPSFGRDGAEDAVYAKESARMLEDMAQGREVRLFYPGLTRDRYDRALAYVLADDALGPELWLNHEMVRRGGVRVRIYPDTARLGEALLEAEKAARLEKAGLWRKRVYHIRSARNHADNYAEGHIPGFEILKGELGDEVHALRPRAVCARELDAGAVILDIMTSAASLCDEGAGEVIVRGYLREGRMELVHPLNFERMDQTGVD